MITTENGAPAWSVNVLNGTLGEGKYKELISIMTELFTQTNRSTEYLFNKVKSYLDVLDINLENENLEENNFLALMLSYCIYKRDIKNGGGRRDESRAILLAIASKYNKNKELIKYMLESYFKQGYWGDAMKLLEISLNKKSGLENIENYDIKNLDMIRNIVMEIIKERLKQDHNIIREYEKKIKIHGEDDSIKQISNLGKWITLPKRKCGKKSKDRVNISLSIARFLFPTIKKNEYYNIQGTEGKKEKVTEKTPVYLAWHGLLARYRNYIKKFRKYIPFVEKHMQKEKYSSINPRILTSSNKLRYDRCFKNLPPRFLISKSNKQAYSKYSKKYSSSLEIRSETEDRKAAAERYYKYEKEVEEKQRIKWKKMRELKNKINENPDNELEKELMELEDEKIMNFSTGTPVDVLKAYNGEEGENTMYENCIREMMLGSYSKLADLKCLCVVDNSDSMTWDLESKERPIDICLALSSFISMSSCEPYKNKFIQFASKSFVVDLQEKLNKEELSFYDHFNYMKNHDYVGCSTNFEAVLGSLKLIFEGANENSLPKYVLFFSDMQFDEAINTSDMKMSAGEQMKKLFNDLGFSKSPTLVFWNLAEHDNRPAVATDDDIVMLSGYNPKMLLDLDSIINNSISQSEYNARQEYYNEKIREDAKINTWKTLTGILSSSESTVNFLEELKKLLKFNLLD